jgi:predicted membrane channel-forming protein YqfA (hemolysin III family)
MCHLYFLTRRLICKSGVDPASTIYYYDTVPGYLIISLRVVVLGYFCYNIYQSWRAENHPVKRRFYLALGCVYSVWFLVLPFVVLIALAISPWVRQRAVMATYYTLNTVAFGILAYLLWPTNASAYFKIAPPEIGETREVTSSNAYEAL